MGEKVLSSEALLTKWNEFAPLFSRHLEKNYYHLCVNLVCVVREGCGVGSRFLEVGCGGGGGTALAVRYVASSVLSLLRTSYIHD
jgi:hypothetical protein